MSPGRWAAAPRLRLSDELDSEAGRLGNSRLSRGAAAAAYRDRVPARWPARARRARGRRPRRGRRHRHSLAVIAKIVSETMETQARIQVQ